MIGDLDGADQVYDMARDLYQELGSPNEYECEEWIDAAINIYETTRAFVELNTNWIPWKSTQIERIDAKYQHFSRIVEEIIARNSWE